MSWSEVDKNKLIQAVDVLELVPQRAGVPSSDFIKVTPREKGIEMSLSSIVTGVVRVALSASLDATTSFFIDKGLFYAYIQGGKSWKGNFKMKMTDSKWILRHGSRYAEFALRTEPLGGYGSWRDRNGLKEIKLSERLRKLLLASNECSTADPSLPQLNCVYIGGKLVLSTNKISLFVGVRDKEDSLRIPFPVGIIPLLGNSLVEGVGIESEHVFLDCGCGYIEGSISAVAQKSFPKKNIVDQVVKGRTWPILVRLPAERLSRVLTRLTSYLANVKREDWQVVLTIAEGVVKAAVSVQQGTFEEKMTFDNVKAEGVVRWPLELAQAVVNYMALNGELVKIRVSEEKNTPYLLSGGGVEMMVARQVGK
jgi:hypothetical protein